MKGTLSPMSALEVEVEEDEVYVNRKVNSKIYIQWIL